MKKSKIFYCIVFISLFLVLGVSVPVNAITSAELQDMIAKLQAQIVELQQQLASMSGGTQAWCHNFDKNLRIGDSGDEVENIIKVLAKEGLLNLDNLETKYSFDEQVASVVSEFQEKYASEVLTPSRLKRGTGYVGPATRKKLNKLYGCKVACTQEAKQCPDGSYVSRTGPNCEFAQCPKTQCNTDSDCPQTTCSAPVGSSAPTCIAPPIKCIDGKCVSDNTQPPITIITPKESTTILPSIRYITVISPNGGESYKKDDSGSISSSITVKWSTTGVSSSHKLNLIRLRAYPNGQEYNLAEDVLNDGQETIVIPSSVPVGAYTLEIKSYMDNILVFDASDSYFKISSPVAALTAYSSYLIDNQTTYTAGQTIKFSVKGVASDYNAGTPSKGFNVQAWLQDSNNQAVQINGVYQSVNAEYNSTTGYWDVTMTAPSDTSKTYTIDTAFYCSNSQLGCASGQINKSFTFTIVAVNQPSITVLSPNGGETFNKGQDIIVRWNSSNVNRVHIWADYYNSNGVVDPTNSMNGGECRITYESVPSTGSLTIVGGNTGRCGILRESNMIKIIIQDADLNYSSVIDTSDNYFSIASDSLGIATDQNQLASIAEAIANIKAEIEKMFK